MPQDKNIVDVDGASVPMSPKPFDTTQFEDGTRMELYHGDLPHSTRDNNTYAKIVHPDDPEADYYEAFDGHRVLTDVKLHTYNYLKSSYYSGSEIRKGGTAEILMNGRVVYSFFFREVENACIEAYNTISKIFEHPLRVWAKDEEIVGRKVYYDRTPAIITNFDGEEGTVTLKAEEGHAFPIPVWWNNEWDGEYTASDRETVRVDYIRSEVWWFRDTDKQILKSAEGVGKIAKAVAREEIRESITKAHPGGCMASIQWSRKEK